MANLSNFDFQFPRSLIAQVPLARGASRMMVVKRHGQWAPPQHDFSRNFHRFLSAGDCLVLNESKVIPARLAGRVPTGGKLEFLLLRRVLNAGHLRWEAMAKPLRRCKPGVNVRLGKDFSCRVIEPMGDGHVLLEFDMGEAAFQKFLRTNGKIPLPPYIKREPNGRDRFRYQSVFAREPGSVAAPTASFHLSNGQLRRIESKGVHIIKAVLHVGAGTFRPVVTENIAEHKMHSEWFSLSEKASLSVNNCKKRGGKVWAVGTTAARILESAVYPPHSELTRPVEGETRLFIYPGYDWNIVDGLLTNFHWPKSTLFMLVCSIIGAQRARSAYQLAFTERYRLFSYGDAMLIF